MASDRDRQYPHQVQVHPQVLHHYGGVKTLLPEKGPSASQVLAVLILLPVGGTLLALAGLTLAGSLIGLLLATPLFILFSPVLVPAAIAVGLSVTGFLASGVFGLTGFSSLSWVLNWVRQATGTEHLDEAKRRMQDMAGYLRQKTKETAQAIQNKAYEAERTHEGGRT